MINERIERIRKKAISKLEEKVQFWEELIRTSQQLTPMFHQINPIYEVINNGIKRLLLAGATSSGKTLQISLIISYLNKKRKRKTLWIAPDQALKTALAKDVPRYLADFKLPPLKIASIEDPNSIQSDADIITINYCKLGYLPLDDNRFVTQILKAASSVDIIVLDECHNVTSSGD